MDRMYFAMELESPVLQGFPPPDSLAVVHTEGNDRMRSVPHQILHVLQILAL